MKIAVTTENENVFQHFGQCPLFTIYEAEDGKIKTKEPLDARASGHSALAGFLKDAAIDVVICGGIGAGARNMLAARGIKLVSGVEGKIDAAVRAFLAGELTDMGSTCHHHDHEHGHGHGDNHDCSCREQCH